MGKSKELAELGDVVTQDSGNMLVGTTGHFNYSSGTTEITVGTDGTGSSAGGAVTFVSNNGATTLGYAGFQESEAAIGTMGSRALKLTTDNTARITVDASGRVTMPYQPYFAAEMNGDSAYNTTSVGSPLPFQAVHYNVGSHFNTSTYKFTAPVTGKYLFTASIITNQSSPVGRMQFYVNNSPDGNNIKWGISGSNTAGGGDTNTSAIVYLYANDAVDVRSQSGNIVNYQSGHSSFTGMLLG